MKMLLSLIVLFLLNPANLYSQEKLPARPTDLPEAKPPLRSEWKKGYQDKSRTRWDDRFEGRLYNALKTGSCFKAQTFSCRPV